MGEAYWAARKGDVLLHTSVLADYVEAAVEILCYAAITAVVSFAIFGTVVTGGLAAICTSVIVGLFMYFSGGSDLVSDLAEKVSSLCPLSEDGQIETGSHNTHTNSKLSARAAGIIDKAKPVQAPQQPEDFHNIHNYCFKIKKQN